MNNNPIPVSDALAKKLGMYQKMSSLCKLLGAVSAVLVFVVFFAVRNKAVKSILDTVLFFAAFGLIYAGNFLYKKMRETMPKQGMKTRVCQNDLSCRTCSRIVSLCCINRSGKPTHDFPLLS